MLTNCSDVHPMLQGFSDSGLAFGVSCRAWAKECTSSPAGRAKFVALRASRLGFAPAFSPRSAEETPPTPKFELKTCNV